MHDRVDQVRLGVVCVVEERHVDLDGGLRLLWQLVLGVTPEDRLTADDQDLLIARDSGGCSEDVLELFAPHCIHASSSGIAIVTA
jgi:hypothetical protein